MEDRIEAKPRASRERLILWLIVVFLAIVFIVGTVVSIVTGPKPHVMAPGPHYHYSDPLENI